MQDLTPQPITTEENEAMQASAQLGAGVDLGGMFTQMGQDLTVSAVDNIRLPNPNAIQYTHGGTLGAPEPQPSGENPHNLADIINTICTQLQLLATVITQHQANTTPPESNQSLQETLSLTLQQADWFKDLIRHELVALDIESIAEGAVESIVENEVESYFSNQFDPSDHFDFGDAVCSEVSDQIDDVVRDRLDDVVQEQLDNFMENATIKIER
jgi:hypothetical protein